MGAGRHTHFLVVRERSGHVKAMCYRSTILLLILFELCAHLRAAGTLEATPEGEHSPGQEAGHGRLGAPFTGVGVRKLGNIVIYRDDRFYSAFPSIVRRPNGLLLVAFRRAPERRVLGEGGTSHTDPNSYLMLVRSTDGGKTWSRTPELIYANPFGGSQDPCMVQLRDGSILCSSYGWALMQPEAIGRLKNPARVGNFVFLGGYLLRSKDAGRSWQGPLLPPAVPGETVLDPFGNTVPAYNRGAMCQGKDGKLYWVVAASAGLTPEKTGTHLLISSDAGGTWRYSCPVAVDDKVTFNETSLYETPKGDLVAFMRSEGFQDHTAVARSKDHGQTFLAWQDAGFQGHPHYALRLPDCRVLLVYGYRHPPFGIRARVLDPECTNFVSAEEIVLRDDGGNGDLGYPWAAMLSKHEALVVYYFNQADGTRHIAGTMLAVD
jgi:sialidase-1